MFYPEMHDVGKMFDYSIFVDDKGKNLTTDGRRAENHSLLNLDWSAFSLSEPTTLTWKVAKYHHLKEKEIKQNCDLNSYEKTVLLLLMFSDRLASQFGRMHTFGGFMQLRNSPVLRKPWEAGEPQSYNNLVNDKKTFLKIIRDLQKDLSWVDFKERYKNYLENIPEDKTIGNSLHTLLDHMELTGKLYRLLSEILEIEVQNNGCIIKYPSGGQEANSISQAQQEFNFSLVRADIKTPHRFARVSDLALFTALDEALEQIQKGPYEKHLLFRTNETLWFFLPNDVSYEKIFEPVTRFNCYALLQIVSGPADGLKPGYLTYKKEIMQRFERIKREDKRIIAQESELEHEKEEILKCFKSNQTSLEEKKKLNKKLNTINTLIKSYKDKSFSYKKNLNKNKLLEKLILKYEDKITTSVSSIYNKEILGLSGERINPPICEVCQQRRGDIEYNKGKIVEHLCCSCFDIRERSSRLSRLGEWEKKNYLVAWVKVTLDYDVFEEIQMENYVNWVSNFTDSSGKNRLSEIEAVSMFNPSAAHAVLTKDYNLFLEDLNRTLVKDFNKNVHFIGKKGKSDFFVYSIRNSQDLEKILCILIAKTDEHFNFFKTKKKSIAQPSPVRISVSISNIRYPFYRHWEFLGNPFNDINIHSPNKGSLSVSASKFKYLLSMRKNLRQYKSKSLMHRLAILEGKLGKLAMEVEIIKNKNSNISHFLEKAKQQDITVFEILRYYRIALWDM